MSNFYLVTKAEVKLMQKKYPTERSWVKAINQYDLSDPIQMDKAYPLLEAESTYVRHYKNTKIFTAVVYVFSVMFVAFIHFRYKLKDPGVLKSQDDYDRELQDFVYQSHVNKVWFLRKREQLKMKLMSGDNDEEHFP